MSMSIRTVEQLIEFLPSAPPYTDEHPPWIPVSQMKDLVQLSTTGLEKMRGRFGNAYEHRIGNRTYIYGPLWLRLWRFEQERSPK